jgi:hypothetical protein
VRTVTAIAVVKNATPMIGGTRGESLKSGTGILNNRRSLKICARFLDALSWQKNSSA